MSDFIKPRSPKRRPSGLIFNGLPGTVCHCGALPFAPCYCTDEERRLPPQRPAQQGAKPMEVTLGSPGHEALMAHFEATHKGSRLNREDKPMWKMGYVYCDGDTNMQFLAFREGVAYGIAINR